MLRTCVLGCALMAVLGLTIGCSNSNKDTKPAATKKDEAVTASKARLGEVDTQLTDLKAKMDKATGDEKTRLETKYKDAAAKRDAAKKKVEELDKAAADKWEAVNKEVESALEDAKKAVN
jgi:hypothetical protein